MSIQTLLREHKELCEIWASEEQALLALSGAFIVTNGLIKHVDGQEPTGTQLQACNYLLLEHGYILAGSGFHKQRSQLFTPDEPYLSKTLVVGEMIHDNDLNGEPFSSTNEHGAMMIRMAQAAGVDFNRVAKTNVFAEKPELGNACSALSYFQSTQPAEADHDSSYPGQLPFNSEKLTWLQVRYLPQLARLARDVHKVKPRLIIAVGRTATWAIHNLFCRLDEQDVTRKLGQVFDFVLDQQLVRVVPICHPGYYQHLEKALPNASEMRRQGDYFGARSLAHLQAALAELWRVEHEAAERRARSTQWAAATGAPQGEPNG